ncbi:uncharacterized protein BKA55DRAFT_581542 [Fusarium redolens]|uniref:Uncharacterized protein n=1 Tax=Fusarium redolens TaxID=48865 RepID=A0A9P9JSI9_FUSRE|nr:uncharacterized protein BKA55DRAFT_581542 [Fusarium redolens]KAH7231716.1 hypothetical protein BKA55DRAFT_581542 [Fusarium redolens]
MPPPSVSVESKKQKERDRGRKRRQQLRRQGQARQLREVDSHETIRLVSQVQDMEDGVDNRRSHEQFHRGHPAASSDNIQHLLPEISTVHDSSISSHTSLRICSPTAAPWDAPVARSPRDARQTSDASAADIIYTSAREPLTEALSEAVATAVTGLADAGEDARTPAGRPRRDPALSERELTRRRVRAYRARQHPSRMPQTAQSRNDDISSNWVNSENLCSAQGDQHFVHDDPNMPVDSHQGDDAQHAARDWNQISPNSPVSSATSDLGLDPLNTDHFYPISGDDSRSLSPDRSIRERPTSPIGVADRVPEDLPYLSRFIEALRAQETRSGLEFLESQITTYDRIIQTLFTAECHCPGLHEIHDHARAHSLQERAQLLQNSLPPLTTILDERFAREATKYLHQWKDFLSDEPAEPLSFRLREHHSVVIVLRNANHSRSCDKASLNRRGSPTDHFMKQYCSCGLSSY